MLKMSKAKDPKQFWNLLSNGGNNNSYTASVDIESMFGHFKQLSVEEKDRSVESEEVELPFKRLQVKDLETELLNKNIYEFGIDF